MEKRIAALFEKMKANHFFWSYSGEISSEDISDAVLVETVLKYGDVEDIELVLDSYGRDHVMDVWARRILFDPRFRKLNYYLARVFFDVDPGPFKQERAGHDRGNKLRMLASQNAAGAGKTDN